MTLATRILGAVVAALGIALAARPHEVAEALARPHGTPSEIINARASFGGAIVGVGLLLLVAPSLRPFTRALAYALLTLMLGVGLVRGAGFVLDGRPDRLQWIWLVLEFVLAAAAAAYLRRP